MLEKNKADSRKYFIFKIRDLVHNSHTLEEKSEQVYCNIWVSVSAPMMNLGHPLTNQTKTLMQRSC